jgi:hypothetical protein
MDIAFALASVVPGDHTLKITAWSDGRAPTQGIGAPAHRAGRGPQLWREAG